LIRPGIASCCRGYSLDQSSSQARVEGVPSLDVRPITVSWKRLASGLDFTRECSKGNVGLANDILVS